MIDLKLNNTNTDLLIEDYDLGLVEDVDQIVQNLAIRLRFFLGEWYLNTEAGLPYYTDILIKNPNQARVESLIKEEIINTDGVEEILSFVSNYDGLTRKFTVDFEALTISGIAALEQELL